MSSPGYDPVIMSAVDPRMAGVLFCLLAIAAVTACIQVPGFPWTVAAPDPVVGQWVAGEPPQTDFHMVFFENHTYQYSTYYLQGGSQDETGNWTKTGQVQYTAESEAGNVTTWSYDPTADSVYINGLPLLRFTRYKG